MAAARSGRSFDEGGRARVLWAAALAATAKTKGEVAGRSGRRDGGCDVRGRGRGFWPFLWSVWGVDLAGCGGLAASSEFGVLAREFGEDVI